MKKILIAEDDPGLSYVLRHALSPIDGLMVLSAHNGEEAWKLLKGHSNVSVIVTDIVMPGLNGIEFRRKILQDETLKEIPFVFITGRLEHLPSTSDLNPTLVLTKPVLGSDFRNIISNLLHLK